MGKVEPGTRLNLKRGSDFRDDDYDVLGAELTEEEELALALKAFNGYSFG